MNHPKTNPWLHRFAILTALATLGLVGIGGLVTSHGVGMSVPDWPTSYGYNMFALPISTWLTGGIFHEHTHRLWASFVGVLVVALTRWMGGSRSRIPLISIGAIEIVSGIALVKLGSDWKGAGHFLSGIGGVVLLAGIVWTKNTPSAGRLPLLGWIAFWLVQVQGLLGGLRVVLDAHILADVRLGTAFGIVHGCLGQGFLVLLAVIALMTGRWWNAYGGARHSVRAALCQPHDGAHGVTRPTALRRWFVFATVLIFIQLLIGATMRHQHAGLAISDFPKAHGAWWPDMSDEAVARYNLQRVEITAVSPITAFQIGLQMAHRIVACLILLAVGICAWRAGGSAALKRIGHLWFGLIFIQVCLGAWTIWSHKAADVATAHVVVGALSLVTGALGCLICFRARSAAAAAVEPSLSESDVARRVSA